MRKRYIFAIHIGDNDFHIIFTMYWRYIHAAIMLGRLSIDDLDKQFIVESFHKALPFLLFTQKQNSEECRDPESSELKRLEKYLQITEADVVMGEQEVQDMIAKNDFNGDTYFYDHSTYLEVPASSLNENMYIYTY